MKIAEIEAIPVEIPFTHAGKPAEWDGRAWNTLTTVLVKVETEEGITGWGDAFSYNCCSAVTAAVRDMIAPRALGRDAADIGALMVQLQQELHLWGRYGITLFALSGLDIALWDAAAKQAGVSLSALLGGARREIIPGYASLFKYRDPEIVAERCRAAIRDGYPAIKLHETEEAEVKAAREAVGPGVALMVDTNCPWTPEEAHENALRLKPYALHWLEEPIFPPEDFAALAKLRADVGIPIAAGENACTAYDFEKMFQAGAVTYAQPSVTKVGGITEFLEVAALAEKYEVELMPHSPYFGPGFLASLHLAALSEEVLIERFYVDMEASLYGDLIDTSEGEFRLPPGPGIGPDPDPDVIRDYRIAE